MKRILLFLLLSFSMTTLVQAQVTKLVSNQTLEFVTSLGTGKALLMDPNFKTLWVTDGTPAGTFKITDTLRYSEVGGLLNGNYIFAATSGTFGNELWITDGTKEGTKLVKDINPGKTSADPEDDFVLLNGYLYFSASAPGSGREIWRTNGTEGGTTLLKDIIPGPGGSAVKGSYNLSSNGSYLLFSMLRAGEGYELWKSDGTEAGTDLLKDINPGAASSSPTAFQVHNNIVLFWAERAGEGRELWRTDGTTGGTQLVKDIRNGPQSSINVGFPMPNFAFLYPFKNQLLFIADDGIHDSEIWTTDGTTAGTKLLKDINDEDDLSFIGLANAVPMNGKLYFTAYHPANGGELWETDGTTNGTKLFKEVLPGSDAGIPILMPNLKFTNASSWPVHQGNFFYFMFGLPADGGLELWKSNGTDAGTVKVKTLKTTDSDWGNPTYVYTNAGLYFSLDDREHGDELWKSDGTEAGTSLVKDLNPNKEEGEEEGEEIGEGSNISFFFVPVNNFILFTATDGDNDFMEDLYRLDGVFAPLPVKLQDFTVSLAGADAQLLWQTASEQNTLDFVIERSDDGSRFTRIGSVAAAGESNSKKQYAFTDGGIANSGKTVVYYRLRMRDKDGKETFSKVVSLNLKEAAGFTIQLLGNPVQSDLRISFSKTTAPVNLTIRDASGRTVKMLQVKSENSVITIPAGNLSPGAYFLTAESNGKSSLVKFLKQ